MAEDDGTATGDDVAAGGDPATDDGTAAAHDPTARDDPTPGDGRTVRDDGLAARAAAALDLETWTVATFDVSAFVLLGVVAGHASGFLADVLPGLGTLPGVLAFAYLWILGVVAVDWALPAAELHESDDLDLHSLAARGSAAGAFVGAGFVAGFALVFAAPAFLAGANVLPFLAVVLVVVAIAALVGSVVGLVFVLLDVALFLAADRLVPRSTAS